MPIISISLNEKILADLDRVQKALGFNGRSEAIRAASRMLIEDSREKSRLKGRISAVLMAVHAEKAESSVSHLKHEFEDVIKTQIHNHLKEGKCLEIFVLEGDAARATALLNAFKRAKGIDYVKMIVA